jgi:hypothetical protein
MLRAHLKTEFCNGFEMMLRAIVVVTLKIFDENSRANLLNRQESTKIYLIRSQVILLDFFVMLIEGVVQKFYLVDQAPSQVDSIEIKVK